MLFLNLSFLTISFVGISTALSGSEKPLVLSEAIKQGLFNNPTVLGAKEKLSESDFRVPLAVSQMAPQLQATGGASRKKDPLLSLSPPLFKGESYNAYQAALQIRQPLFTGGALWSGIHVEQVEREIRRLNLEVKERDLSKSILGAFYQILLNRKRIVTLEETQKIYQGYLKRAETRYKFGLDKKLEALDIKAEISLLQPRKLDAENKIKIQGATLAHAMGSPEQKFLVVQGSLEAPPWKEVEKVGQEVPLRRAELESMQEQQKKVEYQKQQALGKHWPQVAAVGSFSRASIKKENLLDSDTNAWSFGIEVQVPLFSGLSSVFERRSLNSQIHQLEISEAELQDSLSVEQIQASQLIENSEAQILAMSEALKLIEEAREVARKAYGLGTITYIQLFTVERKLLDTSFALEEAKANHIINMANFFSSRGWPLDLLVSALEGKS